MNTLPSLDAHGHLDPQHPPEASNDPPAAIPCRVERVEHLAGQQYGLSQPDVRSLCWRNLARLVERTGTAARPPRGLRRR